MSDNTITLELTPRELTGKAVKRLRRDGLVPAVIHNHGKPSIAVQGPYLAMKQTYMQAGKHHPVIVKAGEHSYTTLIKTATFEPRKNQLSHIVFNAVDKKQKVETEVPVRARYDEGNEASPAERAGLIVLEQLNSIEVRTVPDKIPDVLEYPGEKLVAVGDQVTVADLTVPEGVELLVESEHPIATVYEPSALAAANDAAGGTAEPEAAEEVPSEQGTTEEGTPTEGSEQPEQTEQSSEQKPADKS